MINFNNIEIRYLIFWLIGYQDEVIGLGWRHRCGGNSRR